MTSPNRTDGERLDDAAKAQGAFQISKMELIELVKAYKGRTYDEEIVGLETHGGVDGISNKLKVNVNTGITGDSFTTRTEFFGNNYREPLKAKGFCKIFFEALDDFMLKVLIVAATGSLIFEYIGADSEDYGHAWFDGAAIYLAVLIVSGFSAFVDWRKEKEFVKRSQADEDAKVVTVIRPQANGVDTEEEIHINYLHVGDIIKLKYGDVVPVDGVLIKGSQFTTNEAAMTGESDERKKDDLQTCIERRAERAAEGFDRKNAGAHDSHALPSPFILSGTNVASGEGEMIAIMVGDSSALGEIMKKLEVRPQATPLQEKLEFIATEIGKVGTYAALLTVHILLFRYFLDGLLNRDLDLFGGEPESKDSPFTKNFKLWVDYVVIGVAVIVVAVPEGLPLAVMISLAYSQGKMLKDQNYVKKLAACEIMGGATNICSDKTGTLTLNQMKVAWIWAGKDIEMDLSQDENKKMIPIVPTELMTESHWNHIATSISCNIPDAYGATDKGMVDLLERGGVKMDELKKKHKVMGTDQKIRFPFTSKRKRMSTVIQNAHGKDAYDRRLLVKGASEIVTASCDYYLDANGQQCNFTDTMRTQVGTVITNYAKKALRTIALAYRDIEPGLHGVKHDEPRDDDIKTIETKGLTLICILGIYDVIRTEVPGAVEVCQKAGVTVRMVTGDNITTAKAIAEKCKIITAAEMEQEMVCVQGPEFYDIMGGLICLTCKKPCPNDCECETDQRKERVKNLDLFKTYMPKMKVMARSRPEDKYLLVTGLMNCRQVVAVTGDGTNDAPALSKADVGFGMGLTGTAVCLAAADIIIQDDSFTSVVKACSWGRNIYDNIKRFLQFQLTVNVNALLFTVLGAILLQESPLQAIQLLWVNMIMDSLASLALATELPKPNLLERPPQNRDDFIVSRKMTKHIIYMSLFQMVLLFIFLFGGEYMIPEPEEKLRFNELRPLVGYEADPDNTFVFPGRLFKLNGDDLYNAVIELPMIDGDASRHMTFIFNLFIWLQIVNMIAARKINDELNLCEDFFANPAFIIIWIIIIVVNFLIIQYTGAFFSLHPDGLAPVQHGLCIGVSLSVLIFNAILKCLPDDVSPVLGKDSVDEKRLAEKAAAREAAPIAGAR